MPKPAEQRASERIPAFQVLSLDARTVLRLKSWEPLHVAGDAVMLAGCELPSKVGATLAGPPRILCTAPAEWLIVSQEPPRAGIRKQIEGTLAVGLALVDLTDGLSVFEARGTAVRDVLAKVCGLDFHPRRFPFGRCARTRFAQIPVVIDCIQDPNHFELYVARSYAHYLKECLQDAAVEFEGAAP